MIIDAVRSSPSPLRVAGALGLVASAWIAVLVALSFFSPAGHAIAILGSPERALSALAQAGGTVVSQGRYVTIARSDRAGFVARLYAAGALLVLDADQVGGCSGLTAATRRPAIAALSPPRL